MNFLSLCYTFSVFVVEKIAAAVLIIIIICLNCVKTFESQQFNFPPALNPPSNRFPLILFFSHTRSPSSSIQSNINNKQFIQKKLY